MEPIVLTRRNLFASAAAGAGALMLGDLLAPPRASAAIYPRTQWLPAGTLVTRPVSSDPRQQVLWTTIMRVEGKLTAPRDRFYLWHSTHDAPILRLYTAPAVTGPWTERPLCKLPAAPAGWDPNHFQCPDIVWDRIGRRFIASPHSKEAPGLGLRSQQNTFVMQSLDGETWTYLDAAPQPMIPIGALNDFDGYAADYGRFLRDYDGNLVKRGGKYVWYYRGTRRTWSKDAVSGQQKYKEHYTLGAATSTDLRTWTKHPGPIGDPGAEQLFGLGSALDVDGVTSLMWTIFVPPMAMFVKTAKSTDPFAFDAGPGTPANVEPAVFFDGGSYIIDGRTHYMTYCAQTRPGTAHEVRLARAVAPTDPLHP